jgi:LysR family transcriptional activator of nhaA
MDAANLNFHHLRYFWEVARDGNLTRTAARLRVSPSALSVQIRQVEDQLGERLFARKGRALELTEAGRIALDYAETIFATGKELLATLGSGPAREKPLRIGAVATLSRNFQESFVRPLLGEPGVRLRLVSGGLDDLLRRLAEHSLDVVLANDPVRGAEADLFRCRRVARQRVSLVARPRRKGFRFPQDAEDVSFLLPGTHSAIRAAFDATCERLGVSVRIFAEIDDMAMIRLLARDADAVALLPAVVVRDELTSGVLREYGVIPGVFEDFYAITVERKFQHPLVKLLLSRPVRDLLGS